MSDKNKIGIIPITVIDGTPTVPEELLRHIWARMVESGRHKTVFYDGHVASEAAWMRFILAPSNSACLAFDMETPEPLLVAWLNGPGPNFAFGHFCGIGKPGRKIIEAGVEVLRVWARLRNSAGARFYQIILGLVPESNDHAQRYIQRLGLRKIGTIPKVCHQVYDDRTEGGVLWYADMEDY